MELTEFLNRLNLENTTVILQKRKENVNIEGTTVEKTGIRSYLTKTFFDQGSVAVSGFMEYTEPFPEMPFEVLVNDLRNVASWCKNIRLEGKTLYWDDGTEFRSGTLPLLSDPAEIKMKRFNEDVFQFSKTNILKADEIERILEGYDFIKPEHLYVDSREKEAVFRMENVEGKTMQVRTGSIGVLKMTYPKMFVDILRLVSKKDILVSYSEIMRLVSKKDILVSCSEIKKIIRLTFVDTNTHLDYYIHPISVGLSQERKQKKESEEEQNQNGEEDE